MFNIVWFLVTVLYCALPTTEARGVLLLYRPRDVTADCAISEHLRFDLSYGMGLSDTITLVLRTLTEVDYECEIDITTNDAKEVAMLIVIRFPNAVNYNCRHNPYAFTILKKHQCIRLCEEISFRVATPYFHVSQSSRFRFQFVSNSSINKDMQAYLYEVTATTARPILNTEQCLHMNETFCEMDEHAYCFTSGVFCDGIKNCGVPDWFDERKADCEMPVNKMGHMSVIAVGAALACAVLAAVHITIKCLPPTAHSFFIFNINEDNRLFVEPVFRDPNGAVTDIEIAKRHSLIPIDYSSSSISTEDTEDQEQLGSEENNSFSKRKNTMKAVTRQQQIKIKSVTARIKNTTGTEIELNTSSQTNSK